MSGEQLALRIASNPPRQLRMAKRLLREGQGTRLDSSLELAAALQGACHHTRDHEEAMPGPTWRARVKRRRQATACRVSAVLREPLPP